MLEKEIFEVETTFEQLFSAVSHLENHTFIHEQSLHLDTDIEIMNLAGKWCKVPALITKLSPTVDMYWSNGSVLSCADHHLIRTHGLKVKFASELIMGDEIEKANGEIVTLVNIENRSLSETVYDLQIDSPEHLYQCANGIVHHNTHLAQTLARFLDVPCIIYDATGLTEAGYVGDDVENIVGRLLVAAGGDVKAAEQGIIFIDEIDKKGKKTSMSSTRDVSGEGVQQALLRILEGNDVMVNKKNGNEGTKVNTKNILFILSGAFSGIENIIQDKKTSIGFGNSDTKTKKLPFLKAEHLIKFGLIPELVGRIPIVAQLDALTKEQLVKVLTEPKNSIIKQFQAMFSLDDVIIEFTPEALIKLAEEAIANETGARALRSVIENALMQVQYDLPDLCDKGLEKVIVNEEVFTNNQQPILIYSNENIDRKEDVTVT